MKEQLITFETAKLANEKGFNSGVKDTKGLPIYYLIDSLSSGSYMYKETGELYLCTMPRVGFLNGHLIASTQSTLQKWLREEHDINVFVQHWNCAWMFSHQRIKMCSNGMSHDNFKSYEDALEQGLIEALKLIK